MKAYRVPKTFADDHWSRDCGEDDYIISENKLWYIVEFTPEGYADMLSDAHYYWDAREDFDWEGGRRLAEAAKRVYDSLMRQGPPINYRVERRGYSPVLVNETTGERVRF